MRDLIDWLEQRRLAQGMTNDAFAQSLGWSAAKWSRLQNRQQTLDAKHLGEIVAMYPAECVQIITLFRESRIVA